ncbi:bb062898-4469-4ead-b1f9-82d1e3654ff3 [Sclerotinia trifoliorum]|uniref:Bb062898-4469-4ead-b1f9-82d1e3654ff3 n=1 Tax=Sclerotinia trifoliorum TaxID=28548 RepID=A0A8H2ZPA0_9HELO|nr:bb062898-4469-4ead-b1f9-82d1e3654ff3 [Sclerotinia trifoliorum]
MSTHSQSIYVFEISHLEIFVSFFCPSYFISSVPKIFNLLEFTGLVISAISPYSVSFLNFLLIIHPYSCYVNLSLRFPLLISTPVQDTLLSIILSYTYHPNQNSDTLIRSINLKLPQYFHIQVISSQHIKMTSLSECKLLAKIWCSPTPKAPLIKALHSACLTYLESTKLYQDPEAWPILPPIKNIQQLPSEILSLIMENLTPVDKGRLRVTNHFYHATIPRPTVTHEDLLAAESQDYEQKNHLLACGICCRLRHISNFGNVQITGRRARSGPQRHKRFCLDCGVKKLFYRPDGYIYVGTNEIRLCPEHRRFECTARCLSHKNKGSWDRASWREQINLSYSKCLLPKGEKLSRALKEEELHEKFKEIVQHSH